MQLGMKQEGELGLLDWTFDCHAGEFAVALGGVTVAGGEERACDADGQEQGASGNELLAVDISAAIAWRTGRMFSRFVGRHAHDAKKRREAHAMPGMSRRNARGSVDAPKQRVFGRIIHAEVF